MWGKIELKQGMIGRVTILKDTDLYRLTNNKLYVVRKAKKGQEFGVYSYKKDFGGLYGLGGGIYVKKSSSIKYETPSKAKLEQLKLVINEGFYTIYNELQSYKISIPKSWKGRCLSTNCDGVEIITPVSGVRGEIAAYRWMEDFGTSLDSDLGFKGKNLKLNNGKVARFREFSSGGTTTMEIAMYAGNKYAGTVFDVRISAPTYYYNVNRDVFLSIMKSFNGWF